MNLHNIKYAVVCGRIESRARHTNADNRFIPEYQDYHDTLMPVEQFENHVMTGKIKVFGEGMVVYKGLKLTDAIYQPYRAICEKYAVPVAYHSGGSFRNAQQFGWPKYRIALGDPFLIEDVWVRYPKLKVYLMHAGENFFENTLHMLDDYSTFMQI